VAERTVAGQDRDRVVACRPHCPLGVPGECLVDLHAEHVVGTEPVGQQGGVVAGTTADLQHPLTRLGARGGEHLRHHARMTGGAGNVASPPLRAGRVTVVYLDGH
jgi:hypothetical protein